MSIQTSEFRRGLKIEMEGIPYQIVEMQHIQQKRRAVIKTKLRNVLNGSIAEYTFLSGERVDSPDLEEKNMEYLYQDGEHYIFMDNESFEQLPIDEKVIEDVIPCDVIEHQKTKVNGVASFSDVTVLENIPCRQLKFLIFRDCAFPQLKKVKLMMS